MLPEGSPLCGSQICGRTNPGQLIAIPQQGPELLQPAVREGRPPERGLPELAPARAQWGWSATPRSRGFESQGFLVFWAL